MHELTALLRAYLRRLDVVLEPLRGVPIVIHADDVTVAHVGDRYVISARADDLDVRIVVERGEVREMTVSARGVQVDPDERLRTAVIGRIVYALESVVRRVRATRLCHDVHELRRWIGQPYIAKAIGSRNYERIVRLIDHYSALCSSNA